MLRSYGHAFGPLRMGVPTLSNCSPALSSSLRLSLQVSLGAKNYNLLNLRLNICRSCPVLWWTDISFCRYALRIAANDPTDQSIRYSIIKVIIFLHLLTKNYFYFSYFEKNSFYLCRWDAFNSAEHQIANSNKHQITIFIYIVASNTCVR